MKNKLRNIYFFFLLGGIIPLLALSTIGVLNLGLRGIGPIEGVFIFTAIIPIATYFFISKIKLDKVAFERQSNNKLFTIELTLSFYLSFFMFMIAILFAFNLLIVGGFLLNDQVPMGMQLQPQDAVAVIAVGLGLLTMAFAGSYYLVHSKRILRPIKTVY